MDRNHVAVVGGGLAGLTAAYKLARGGMRVTVYEKSSHLGGRAATIVRDDFHLNQGPHALYKGGRAYKFLSQIGATPAGGAPASARALAVFGGRNYDLPVDFASLLRTKFLGLFDKFELAGFFKKLPTIDSDKVMSVSLSAWLEANISRPRVRTLITALARLSTYSSDSERMAAGAALRQLNLAGQGVLYLDDGWQTMIASLQSALGADVTFKLGAQVARVQAHRDYVEIFEGTDATNCERYDAVVLALPPHVVNDLMPGCIAGNLEEDIFASNAACLDVCLKSLPVSANTFVLGLDENLYLSVHTAGAKLAPPGCALIHLAVYLREGEPGGAAHKERLERLLDSVQPGWREQLLYERFLPNMTSSFGMATAKLGGANGLANPALGVHGNVYACGDWVGSGYLLADAAVDSALKVVELIQNIAERDGRKKEQPSQCLK